MKQVWPYKKQKLQGQNQVVCGFVHIFRSNTACTTFLKRGKKALPYIDIGGANKGLAIANRKKEKEKGIRNPRKEKKVSPQALPGSLHRLKSNPFLPP